MTKWDVSPHDDDRDRQHRSGERRTADTTQGDPAHIAADDLRATVAKQAARIKELEAELATIEPEYEHYLDLAFVDLGANPQVAWKDVAAKLEAHNAAMRKASRNLIDAIASGTHWEDGRPSIYNGDVNYLHVVACQLGEATDTDAGAKVADVVEAAQEIAEQPYENSGSIAVLRQRLRALDGSKTDE